MSDEDLYLQSWGWTDLSSFLSSEPQVVSSLRTRTMSRLSLRLDNGLLDHSLPLSSASYSAGGGSWRSSRSLKPRRSQHHSVSCSESLLVPSPRKPSGRSLHSSSVHSVTSDTSLLSSLLDESSIQDATLVDTLWGLDHDVDPKESTIVAEQSTVLANCTLIGSDSFCVKHTGQTLSRVYCKDCELHPDKKESVTTRSSSSKYTTSSSVSGERELETSIVYDRDRSRRRRTARSDHCGVMELKETTNSLKEALHPNGSLCKTGGAILRWLSRRWHHMTAPDRAVLLTRSPPRFVLFLVPLLLFLIGPCWFGLAGIQSILAALNITDWTKVVSDVPALSSIYSFMSSQSPSAENAAEGSGEVQLYEEPLYPRPPPAEEEESDRLVGLEQSLTVLWGRVEAAGQQAEQRHREVLGLYADLQQRVSARSGEDDLQLWLSSLIDHELTELRRRLDEERQREQMQQLSQQQSLSSRLDQLELQLLAAQTEEDQWRREAASVPQSTLPAAISMGVDRQSHDALLAEVARLEVALEDVRRDVDGLSGFKDRCRQLDGVQQTISEQVSAQVREEVRALVYGNQVTVAGGGDSDTLQWLSQQYVSRADLQVALSSLERSILQNIKLQLVQHRNEEVRETVLQTTGTAGDTVTPEDVHVIVKNALRLFSQDQTGLADYALESGGGSVLSTRCSETYETKAALLSLFGLPLWYFSQSPRTVIQPDVHPGNCWAFRGSTGFLVIRLSMRILPTAFSLEHIPKALAPSGALHSAPRDFSVYGLDDERQDRGKLLGAYTYDEDGEALQTYAATEENDQMFQIIEVKVLSNWGHQEYTCIYRFRVHGSPSDV
ncbi:SUN domain-containing protein 1-like isoform X9 [Hippoglossus stenolepis]|uniref:SUN domain-containing protein 1-like isoform X9 n=1 Tax=Hippoglossus stenolepis TaxID=195615 RepID=UPI001FB01CC4|nr:SUN domain-containing protein 1-like isoform X9 [Hippoglossus stenolepis]